MFKVLIVDDETHIAHVLAVWLKRHGFDTLEAGNGVAALALLERETIDLVITDMNMPEMDGLALVQALRERLKLDVPVMVLSARCDQGQLSKQLEPFGVKLYPKPFMPSKLVAEIERILGTAAAVSEQISV